VSTAAEFLERNRDRHLGELGELIRFPSVSSLDRHASDIRDCAEWLAGRFAAVGLEHVDLVDCGGNPIVYGDWLHAGAAAPTALLYGHYDVQPADPAELWTSPPFEATVRDGCLYGRGASDNKGPMYLNLAALEALLAVEGRLPVNVRFVVEGEEELRPDTIEAFIRDDARSRGLDVAVVSDATQFAAGVPGVSLGLRGMAALQFSVRTGREDLHSGAYGGVAANALHAIAALVASLRSEDGTIAVPGFYDAVEAPSLEELELWRELPFDDPVHGARDGEPGFSALERLWARPSLDVNGLWGGFTEGRLKTVIPAVAHATLSCRLVPDQEPEQVLEQLVAHLRRHVPADAELTIDWTLPGSRPYVLRPDHEAVRAALAALAEVYGREPVTFRSGWSVPVTEFLARHLGVDSVLLGFAHADERHHAPDEFLRLSSFDLGTRTMVVFWHRLAAAFRPEA
jgi:acetylornithine deacetylase/succinyl-diaminopimelate desuccinylase-like protein